MYSYLGLIGIFIAIIALCSLITGIILQYISNAQYKLIGYCMLANSAVYALLAIICLIVNIYESPKFNTVELKPNKSDNTATDRTFVRVKEPEDTGNSETFVKINKSNTNKPDDTNVKINKSNTNNPNNTNVKINKSNTNKPDDTNVKINKSNTNKPDDTNVKINKSNTNNPNDTNVKINNPNDTNVKINKPDDTLKSNEIHVEKEDLGFNLSQQQ